MKKKHNWFVIVKRNICSNEIEESSLAIKIAKNGKKFQVLKDRYSSQYKGKDISQLGKAIREHCESVLILK